MENNIKLCEWYNEHWYRIQFEDGTVDYYPSVTTKLSIINKPYLAKWKGDIGNREAKKRMIEAGDRGSRIHNAAQIMTLDGAVIYNPPKSTNYSNEDITKLRKKYNEVCILENQDEMYDIWKIKRMFNILKCQIFGTEFIVYSRETKEAGTVDFAVRFKEDGIYEHINTKPIKIKAGIYLADYKSGSLNDEANMQGAAYSKMWLERASQALKDEFRGFLIVHTGAKVKTGIPGLNLIIRSLEEIEEDYVDFRHTAAMWNRNNKNVMPRLLEFPALLTMEEEEQEEK